MLYISGEDISFLFGERQVDAKPLPATTEVAMEAVPFVFTGVVACMAGMSWIIERRMKNGKDESNG